MNIPRRIGRDPGKVKANDLAYRQRRQAAGLRYYNPESSSAWKRNNRDKVNAYKRRKRAAIKAARPDKARPDPYRRLIEVNAAQAWRYWISEKAPDSWMRAYYRAAGKPWSNPRLTDAQKWKIQYWCDPAFRAKEIEKVQRLKAKRAERIEATCDGTLTGEVIVQLFAQAKRCHYCEQPMRSTQKSLDHVVALSKGGAHSIHNVVIACKPCNTAKGRMDANEFRLGPWQDRSRTGSVTRGFSQISGSLALHHKAGLAAEWAR